MNAESQIDLEDPSWQWVQLVHAFKTNNGPDVEELLNQAKASEWSIEKWEELENESEDDTEVLDEDDDAQPEISYQ